MEAFPGLNGTTPISPAPSGVWKILKKSKTEDHRRKKQKKRRKKDESDPDTKKSLHLKSDKVKSKWSRNNQEEQETHDSDNHQKKSQRKIDLVI